MFVCEVERETERERERPTFRIGPPCDLTLTVKSRVSDKERKRKIVSFKTE